MNLIADSIWREVALLRWPGAQGNGAQWARWTGLHPFGAGHLGRWIPPTPCSGQYLVRVQGGCRWLIFTGWFAETVVQERRDGHIQIR